MGAVKKRGVSAAPITETTLLALQCRHLVEERVVVLRAIKAEGGNLRLAAARLDVGYSTLQRVLRRHEGLADEAVGT